LLLKQADDDAWKFAIGRDNLPYLQETTDLGLLVLSETSVSDAGLKHLNGLTSFASE